MTTTKDELEFSTLVEMFDRVTERYRQDPRPMLMQKLNGAYRGISYATMRSTVDDFALGLAALGVRRNDHVALISENRPEWVIADIGMMKLGAVNVSIYTTLTPKQIEFILNDSAAAFAIASNQFQLGKLLKIARNVPSLKTIVLIAGKSDDPRVVAYEDALTLGKQFANPDYLLRESQAVRPEDDLTIIYTSGTTGNPKGVVLTHQNLVSTIKASASCIPFTHADTVLSFLPLCHSFERMAGYYTALSCGATIAYAESIETVRENLLEIRPTVVTTVPRLFERLYNRIIMQVSESSGLEQRIFHWAVATGKHYHAARRAGRTPALSALTYALADALVFAKIRARTGGRIRFFASGGAALSRELGEFFEAIGIRIIEGYGMTESSPVISVNRLDDYRFGTVGKPIPIVELKIASDGEILVRGPNVMKGYWNNPAATREAVDADGWLHTGDIGFIDPDGFLTITDRKKHLFVSSGGKNIAPQHIENMFLQSRFIEQFVLVGDGRMFLTALVVPDFTILRNHARRLGISSATDEDLVARPEIHQLLEEEMAGIQKDLANYERVRKFTLLSRPLTIEQGEITPTNKVRRKVVEENFRALIEKMYDVGR
jgi:long-chain acyl-CoA synthetase